MDYPVKLGETYEVTVSRSGSPGDGVANVDGLTVFVPGTLPGEIVEIEITKAQPRFAFGRVISIKIPSPHRVTPPCPHFSTCGGCKMQFMDYETEVAQLSASVTDLLQRIGGQKELVALPSLPMSNPWHYRNKAVFRAGMSGGKAVLGFTQEGSHRVVPAPHCLLQAPEAMCAAQVVEDWMNAYRIAPYDERTGKGILRHLMVRINHAREVMVVPVTAGDSLPHAQELLSALQSALPTLHSVVQNINPRRTQEILGFRNKVLLGTERLPDTLLGNAYDLSPLSFYQVNPEMTEVLYKTAIDFAALTGHETVIDAYCGAGAVGLTLAPNCASVIGIEIVPQAIADANENARRAGIKNARFITGNCATELPKLVASGLTPDVILLDPPRRGCDPAVLTAAAQASPSRIVYISCGPDTLARDLKFLTTHGYRAEKAQPVDLFPWTGHVETVALLSKLSGAKNTIDVKVDMDELDVTSAETKATYEEIKAYVLEQTGLQVSNLYIAQVKRECGIIERENYIKPKSEESRQPQCPEEKKTAIVEALKHYHMI